MSIAFDPWLAYSHILIIIDQFLSGHQIFFDSVSRIGYLKFKIV